MLVDVWRWVKVMMVMMNWLSVAFPQVDATKDGSERWVCVGRRRRGGTR